MMKTGDQMKHTQEDDAEVADLYNRCSDYFLLRDGAAPTLDDARELFSDVPPEKSAHNQAVLGWKGPGGLYAIAAILRDYPLDRSEERRVGKECGSTCSSRVSPSD